MVAVRPAAAGRAPKPRNADLAKRRGLAIGGLGAEWPPTAKDSHAFGGKIENKCCKKRRFLNHRHSGGMQPIGGQLAMNGWLKLGIKTAEVFSQQMRQKIEANLWRMLKMRILFERFSSVLAASSSIDSHLTNWNGPF